MVHFFKQQLQEQVKNRDSETLILREKYSSYSAT